MSTPKPGKSGRAATADEGRRTFFMKLGAGVSTALAATAAVARPGSADADDASLRLALLEEEQRLRRLHQRFEQALDAGRYDAAVGLFADEAEVVFNGGIFAKRSLGVRRLYRRHFAAGKSGRRMEPAPGFAPDAESQPDSVEVAADRLSATAAFPYSIRVGVPLESGSSLADMARLQGEGVRSW